MKIWQFLAYIVLGNFIMNLYVRRDYKTITEALTSANPGDAIIIPSGVYKEKIYIEKPDISLIGDGHVTITYDGASGKPDNAGGVYGTFTSATVTVLESAINFKAENIIFENSYNRTDPERSVTQAVALSCGADGSAFYDCSILGWQDTLYLHGGGMQFFHECYIEGSVDFIFGDARVLFEDCDINCVRSSSYITAANTSENSAAGLVFYHCYISACEGCESIFLGRPWHAERDGVNSATAFIECTYNCDIAPVGWLPWHLEPGTEGSNTRYLEYNNSDAYGSQAYTAERAIWSKQLTRDEAEELMTYIGKAAKYPNEEEHEHHEHNHNA